MSSLLSSSLRYRQSIYFRDQLTLQERRNIFAKCINRPGCADKVPVIVEPSSRSNLPLCPARQSIISEQMTWIHFKCRMMDKFRSQWKEITWSSIDHLSFLVIQFPQERIIHPASHQTLGELFDLHASREEDGFLYVQYIGENVFGS